MPQDRLVAISDLHIGFAGNREFVRDLRPGDPGDWLLVAGDVAESLVDVEWGLTQLTERFDRVFWAPGNHELWTPPSDPTGLRGVAKYEALVDMCRRLGVVTPEDPYETWTGPGGPAIIAPMFLLYDYTFRPPGAATKVEALRRAVAAEVVCTDEFLLHPDPYPTREAWCGQRLRITRERLDALPPGVPTVLVNHYPLVRRPTSVLRHPEFAIWCGTEATADWHVRYNATAMVYGHLHIPYAFHLDGTDFHEVSLGYPAEWRRRIRPPELPRRILGNVSTI